MTIGSALARAARLHNATNSAHLGAELLLTHVLKTTKSTLLAYPDRCLSTWQGFRFRWLMQQYLAGVPLAYLTHQKDFYGRTFTLNRHVLIPRPETETLVDVASEIIRTHSLTQVVEIGTGSGCIAISLALEFPSLAIYATDISRRALRVARANCARYNIGKRISFLRGDLLEPVQARLNRQTLIVANLPYVRTDEINVSLKHEPQQALVGGRDGLNCYRKFIWQLTQSDPDRLPQLVAIEIDPRQVNALQLEIKQRLPRAGISITHDLSHKPRVLGLTLA